MRHSLRVLVVAATTTLATSMTWADSQETAVQIAKNIQNSGQLSRYSIAVNFEDGTAQLSGSVRNREQMHAAMKIAVDTPGVDRVVNKISIAIPDAKQPEGAAKQPESKLPARQSAAPQVNLISHILETTSSSKATGDPQPNRGDQPASRSERSSTLEKRFRERMEAATAARRPGHGERATGSHNSAAQQVTAIEPAPVRRQEAAGVSYQNSRRSQSSPIPAAYLQGAPAPPGQSPLPGGPLPMYTAAASQGSVAPVRYDQPCLPNYSWPSYAAYPNYAAVTYPKQYSPTAWPYIGPFYPYPQVPLGWRKVTLQWDDGWWMLDFKDRPSSWEGPLGRWY